MRVCRLSGDHDPHDTGRDYQYWGRGVQWYFFGCEWLRARVVARMNVQMRVIRWGAGKGDDVDMTRD